jgi:predicted transcriptional regulator
MENRIVRVEVKLEMIEKTLERTTDILEELVKSEVQQKEIEKRISKIEATLSRLNWIVLTAVFASVLNIVMKG